MAFIALDDENDLLMFAEFVLAVRDGYGVREIENIARLTGRSEYFTAEVCGRAQQIVNNARVASDRNVSNDPAVQPVEMNVKMPVALVQRGMNLDLEDDLIATGCDDPDCSCSETWKYQYGHVVDIEWRDADAVILHFELGESVVFPPEHMVTVNGKA